MINKIGIKILLVIGIAIAGAGLYFGYNNFQKTLTYEETEGIITGFHQHSNNAKKSYPNVTFCYKGDTVFSKIDYYSSDMTIGQAVVVVFPADNPLSAEIKSSFLFVPLFLLFFSLFFIVPNTLIKIERQKLG
ncbi:MAG: DUF3592 domain-containing protein [Bacteroidetes bacterium]|nr:DUF3592 domain-containing protein [Bacteroidota bacterium]